MHAGLQVSLEHSHAAEVGSMAVVLSGGQFYLLPQLGTFGNTRVLVIYEVEARIVLTPYNSPGQPRTTKNYLTQNVSSAEVEKPGL